MKKFKTLSILILCMNFLFVNSSFSQQKGETLSIVVKSPDNFFVDEGSDFYASFIFKGINDNFNTKEITSKVNALDGVFKFGIKNSSDKIANQRRCYIRLKKDNYLRTFSKVLIYMNVQKVEVNDKLMDADKFILSLKK
ncbi:MAG: hypothetical protein HN704_07930 [Bacteroidetes bacterium]|jgi:hypothetical protein|nr:hypothetical protein [Bacteroidota bacterium]MBT6684990.1 hypothetical protein [Bacteroidota bacterium]MBT7143068.1 hypothetical protein [Bacteroidota bacterium]MBT7491519.1 hypothetical protein [Bacteroidota bacterium]